MIVALFILIAAELLTERRAARFVPRQVMQTIAEAPSTVDVLGIGNSLIAAGFDPVAIEQTFQSAGRRCAAVNGGLGASGVIEHLLLTRFALRHHEVKSLIYGFYDGQLSAGVEIRNSDLIGNRSLLYDLEPQLTVEYARFSMLDRLSFDMCRSSSLLRERGSIWAKVERLRRAMGSLGMPAQETDQFGRKADFALLEAKDTQTFVLGCQRVIRSGEMLSAPVRALLEQAHARGVQVFVVEMPMYPSHVKQFYAQPIWEAVRARTRLAVEGEGAVYVNASGWVPDAGLFADHLHLSKEGAHRFSQELAQFLIQQPGG